MHETTKLNIEKMNEKYCIAASKGRKEVKLEPGDLVWLHLRKERFSELRKSKLMSRVADPFKILAKINDNAYKLELPPEFGVSPSFNISKGPEKTTRGGEGEWEPIKIPHRNLAYCHTRFLCQNRVLIVCMTQDQMFHTYDQKCSQITKCHSIEYIYYVNNVFKN
jgi:hypothetical protein